MEEVDSLGVETVVLGTSNPIAAKLYGSLGFSFLPGSGVMARFAKGDEVDFTACTYEKKSQFIQIQSGSPRMRIPLIPLVLHRGSQLILDCNTGIINCNLMTQFSCMSLFPRYLELQKKGGDFFGAYNEHGVLGAVASILPVGEELRADFFCCDSFESVIPELLKKCQEAYGDFYLQIAKEDWKKQAIAEKCGFMQREDVLYSCRSVQIPSVKYKK